MRTVIIFLALTLLAKPIFAQPITDEANINCEFIEGNVYLGLTRWEAEYEDFWARMAKIKGSELNEEEMSNVISDPEKLRWLDCANKMANIYNAMCKLQRWV